MRIYVAGPLFAEHERRYLEEIVGTIATKLSLDPKRNFFLPHRDAGDIGVAERGREHVFEDDIVELQKSDLVVALLDGSDVDSGTALELGVAFAMNKKIFGILTDWRRWQDETPRSINNMVWGVCGKGERIYRGLESRLFADLRRGLNN